MEKAGAPPSYESAVASPANFPSGPPTSTHPGYAPYPTGTGAAPYPTGNTSAPYPTTDGSAPYPFGAGSAPYPTAGGPAPGFIPPYHQTGGDFKSTPYPSGGPTLSGHIPPHAQSVTQVVIHHVPMNFGDKSQPATCPQCKQSIVTRVEAEPSTQTHLCAALMCAFGIWPCCCLPYCIDSCQKINHYCPNCGVYLGSYQNS